MIRLIDNNKAVEISIREWETTAIASLNRG